MHKARFTEEQMVAIIREADRQPVSVLIPLYDESLTEDAALCRRVRAEAAKVLGLQNV